MYSTCLSYVDCCAASHMPITYFCHWLLTREVLPTWLFEFCSDSPAETNYYCGLFLSFLFWVAVPAMGGMLQFLHFVLHHSARYLIWTSVIDLYMCGVLLTPISVAFRICGMVLLVLGFGFVDQLFIPLPQDVRFWFTSNFDLDLSYLWSPFKYRRKKRCTRAPTYHLRLKVQCRVKWIPVRNPVPRVCRPSTWHYFLCRRKVPTDSQQQIRAATPNKTLAKSYVLRDNLGNLDETVREVTSRLILRNGVEWGLKGGVLVKNAFHFCLENSVQKHFLRTYPGGQIQVALSSVEASQ